MQSIASVVNGDKVFSRCGEDTEEGDKMQVSFIRFVQLNDRMSSILSKYFELRIL